MATRLYLPSSGTPEVFFNAGSGWVSPSSVNPTHIHPLLLTPSNTALTTRSIAEASASQGNYPMKVYVSKALIAQSLSGNFTAVIRGLESATTADDSLQVIIRVMSNDGTVVRATLYAGHTATLNATAGALGQEWPITTQATRIIPSTALSSFTCASGDRLSVEFGFRSHDTSATSATTSMRFGDPTAGADFALTAALTTDLRPWIEFSNNIFFAPDAERRSLVRSQAVNRAAVI